MSLNALIRWLKPREMVFFDLLESSAANVMAAAQLFDQEIRTGDPARWPELRRAMKTLEHTGDELTYQIIEHLNHTFVTPLEREDILELAHSLDDVADVLDGICGRLVLYRMDHMKPAVLELSYLIVAGAGELVHLMSSLRNMSNIKEIRTRIRHVHTLENQGDSIYHTALAELFEDPKDPIELIKWKELLGLLEDATDRIERVAKVVGSTVMRNA